MTLIEFGEGLADSIAAGAQSPDSHFLEMLSVGSFSDSVAGKGRFIFKHILVLESGWKQAGHTYPCWGKWSPRGSGRQELWDEWHTKK